MSNAKRPTIAPTPAVGLDHVQITIVKCLETPDDVVAFLDALPLGAICGPLATVLRLLRAPIDDAIYVATVTLLRLLRPPGDDMRDAGAKAAALARQWSSFVGLDHVLIGILKWFKTPQEVLAFLEGIDTPTLGAPLVALLRLLRAPLDVVVNGGFVWPALNETTALDKMWPVLQLDYVYQASTGLVIDALPAFHAVETTRFGPFEWLVETFGPKLTHLQIGMFFQTMWTAFAHFDRAPDEWTATLAQWLQSGHATRLRFESKVKHLPDGIVRMLAATSSLSHLDVIAVDQVFGSLCDASAMRFNNLQTMRVRAETVLTSLTIACKDDIDLLFEMLTRFSALRVLKLLGAELYDVPLPLPPMTHPLALTSVTLHNVELSANAFLVLNAHFAKSPELQLLSFEGTSFAHDASLCYIVAS
ncbi:hypothetical protein SDRG_17167, partial [Saprolegnia diclina VS20]